jgi:hypothetical protein
MKKENWEFLKFCLLLGVKTVPRLFLAPYVGAVRGVFAVQDRVDAEVDAFNERQLKAREASTSDSGRTRAQA